RLSRSIHYSARSFCPGRARLASLPSLIEIDCGRVAATDDHAYALSGLWFVGPRRQCGERRCSSWLGDNTQRAPKYVLRLPNGLIRHKHRTAYIGFGDRKPFLADALRRQGVRGQTARFRVHRSSGRQCLGKRRGGEWLDADDFDSPRIPGSNSGDKTAASDGHKERIDIRALFSKLLSNRGLPKHGLVLIESVHGHRT